MKRDLTPDQLAQPVIVTLPLSAILDLADREPRAPQAPASAPTTLMHLPAIGAAVHGGIYAGITVHDNKPMALILLPGEKELPWAKAKDWALGDQGGSLPTRVDMLILFQNVKHEFKEEYYWTSEERAGNADYAWFAYFSDGNQYYGHKSNDYRCRAVRRVAI